MFPRPLTDARAGNPGKPIRNEARSYDGGQACAPGKARLRRS